MCGISGIIGNNILPTSIINMVDVLKRRGPDDYGTWTKEDNSISLGHTRLSILDLTKSGKQPMFSYDRRYTIVFNGEIYNYTELRINLIKNGATFFTNTDTEVILRSWEYFGEKCILDFRGMFSFAIWDNIEQKLFLVRDRLGIKPMLYSFQNDTLLFASTISSLLASRIVNPILNTSSLFDYLATGSVFQPKTILKGVNSLMPGNILIYQNGTITIKSYWKNEVNLELNKNIKSLSNDEVVKLTRTKIEEACKYHLVSDVPIASFLSGGVDSTIVTSLMAHQTHNKIDTYSIGFENKYKEYNELKLAQKVSILIGSNHHEKILRGDEVLNNFDDFISVLDQPSIDGLNSYWVSRIASTSSKVAFSGLGADEIFGGYDHFSWSEIANKKVNISDRLFSLSHSCFPNKFTLKSYLKTLSTVERFALLRRRLSDNEISAALSNNLSKNFINNHVENFVSHIGCTIDSSITDISLFECKNYLLNTLLRDSDATSMGNSLEVRPFFLDHELVEFALSLPDHLKWNNGISKFILKEATKDLVPHDFFKRPKKGFTLPIERWMYNEFKDRFIAIAMTPFAKIYFNELFLKKVINDIKKEQNGWNAYLIFIFLEWASKINLKTEFH